MEQNDIMDNQTPGTANGHPANTLPSHTHGAFKPDAACEHLGQTVAM